VDRFADLVLQDFPETELDLRVFQIGELLSSIFLLETDHLLFIKHRLSIKEIIFIITTPSDVIN